MSIIPNTCHPGHPGLCTLQLELICRDLKNQRSIVCIQGHHWRTHPQNIAHQKKYEKISLRKNLNLLDNLKNYKNVKNI